MGGGKKGKSGRKSLAEEVAKLQAIQKAWNKVNREIENKDVEKVALPIALKTMADKSEVKTKVIIQFDNALNIAQQAEGGGNEPGEVQGNPGGQEVGQDQP